MFSMFPPNGTRLCTTFSPQKRHRQTFSLRAAATAARRVPKSTVARRASAKGVQQGIRSKVAADSSARWTPGSGCGGVLGEVSFAVIRNPYQVLPGIYTVRVILCYACALFNNLRNETKLCNAVSMALFQSTQEGPVCHVRSSTPWPTTVLELTLRHILLTCPTADS